MTPERIAEIARLLESLQRTNFVKGFDGWVRLVRECLDALEAAQQEIADLKRGGVVVPELTEDEEIAAVSHYALKEEWPDDGVSDDLMSYVCWGLRIGMRYQSSRLRTVPADRVLGEVAVDREELYLLRQLESGWREPYDLSAGERARIITRLDALRAQPTQEPTT